MIIRSTEDRRDFVLLNTGEGQDPGVGQVLALVRVVYNGIEYDLAFLRMMMDAPLPQLAPRGTRLVSTSLLDSPEVAAQLLNLCSNSAPAVRVPTPARYLQWGYVNELEFYGQRSEDRVPRARTCPLYEIVDLQCILAPAYLQMDQRNTPFDWAELNPHSGDKKHRAFLNPAVRCWV